MSLHIAIDCDDAALELKTVLVEYLRSKGMDVTDLNYSSDSPKLYPEIAANLAKKILAKTYDRGILICGTGIGMCIAANKVEGIYAGNCHDVYSAERLRKSNDGNILTMGARVIGVEVAKKVTDAFLSSEFEGKGSLPKVAQMRNIEKTEFHNNH